MENFVSRMFAFIAFTSPFAAFSQEQLFENIEFSNGFVLEERDGPDSGPAGNNYIIMHQDPQKDSYEFFASRGKVTEVFYSKKKMALAVVIDETDCGSGGCYPWSTLLYATENQIEKETFDNPISLEINVDEDQILNLAVKEKFQVKNDLGDKITKTKYYNMVRIKVPYQTSLSHHIIEDGAKRKFVNLLGKNIFDYFGSDDYRSNLIKELGVEKFKRIRDAITLAKPTKLINRRYVLLNGLQKYHQNYFILALDIITGEEVLIFFDDGLNSKFLTKRPSKPFENGLFPIVQKWGKRCLIFLVTKDVLSVKEYNRYSGCEKNILKMSKVQTPVSRSLPSMPDWHRMMDKFK